MRRIVIIQARMGSTRLPGKVLEEVLGEPMLAHVVGRCRRARNVDEVVVATSTLPQDDAIVSACRARDWAYVRGSEDDVLSRYVTAAVEHRADLVVRLTADCPVIDPALVDTHVERLTSAFDRADFVSNMVVQSFPLGLAVEAMPIDVLHRLDRMSRTARLREHVTTLVYDEPSLFRVEHVTHDEDLSALRWTVDTPEDLALVRQLFGHFGHARFSWIEALEAVRAHPAWSALNAHVIQKHA
jgi:spore coat polysaccharide biosynthesis protein SpsF